MALIAMLLAFGPPLDTAAHVASQAVEAGDTSPILKFVAAFDVLDDALDHLPGDVAGKPQQIVITMGMPAPVLASFAIVHEEPVEHGRTTTELFSSQTLPPLDRPPRA